MWMWQEKRSIGSTIWNEEQVRQSQNSSKSLSIEDLADAESAAHLAAAVAGGIESPIQLLLQVIYSRKTNTIF